MNVKITYKFMGHPAGRRQMFQTETVFMEEDIHGYAKEFECSQEQAINGLADMYIFENYGPTAERVKVEHEN